MPIHKKEEIKEEGEAEVIVEKKAEYRYFCDACTGTAFVTSNIDELPKRTVCASCDKELGVIKKENFIKI